MRVSKLFSALSVVVLVATNALCMLKNIKDTYQILNDDYKHLSICNGAIAWETGFIRRLYDFGQVFYTTKKDKNGLDVIDEYIDLDKTHKTARLVHVLFYRVPGSTGIADFGVTQKIKIKNAEEIAVHCANVLFQIDEIIRLDQDSQKDLIKLWRGLYLKREELAQQLKEMQARNELVEKGGKKEDTTDLSRNIDLLERIIKLPPARIFKLINKEKKKLASISPKELLAPAIKSGQKVEDKLTECKKAFGNLLEIEAIKGADMADVILGSIRECDQASPNVVYGPHITEMILLAFVYKACSHDREALAAFYSALNLYFDQRIIKEMRDEKWMTDSFEPITQQAAVERIKSILSGDEETKKANIKNNYEELFYAMQQNKSIPTPVGYATAQYTFPNGISVSYPDCLDNAIRNCINTLAFDATSNTFAISKLKERLNKSEEHRFNEALEKFLTKYDAPVLAPSPEAHNEWVGVISNIPFVAYKHTTTNKDQLPTGRGFMKMPVQNTELYQELLALGIYEQLSSDANGYEVRALLYNVVMVLNHLLNLGLFEGYSNDDYYDCVEQIVKNNFLETYLPKLKDALGAYDLTVSGDLQGIDARDFNDLISTKFQCKDIGVEFMTRQGHGELKLVGGSSNIEKDFGLLVGNELSVLTVDPSLMLWCTNFLCRNDLASFSVLLESKQAQVIYTNLFAMPLENTNMTDGLVKEWLLHVPFGYNTNPSVELLLRLTDKQPDITENVRLKLIIYKKIGSISLEQIKSLVVLADTRSDIDLNIRIKLMVYNQFSSDQNFNLLFEQNLTDPTYRALLASSLVESSSENIQNRGLALFEELFKQGKGFNSASNVIFDESIWYRRIQDARLKLHELLLNSIDYKSEQIIDVALKSIFSNTTNINDKGSELLKNLVKEGRGLTQAIEELNKPTTQYDYGRKSSVILLIKVLVENVSVDSEYAPELARKACSDYDDNDLQKSGLMLFENFFAKGRAYSEAATLALEALNSDRYRRDYQNKKQLGTDLFNKIFQYINEHTSDAVEIALKATNVNDREVQELGINLFKKLIPLKRGISEAIKVMDTDLRKTLLNVLIKFINDGDYSFIIDSIDVAHKSVNDGYEYRDYGFFGNYREGRQLYDLLFEKIDTNSEYAFNLAIQAIYSVDPDIREKGFGLMRKLFSEKRGLDQALKHFQGYLTVRGGNVFDDSDIRLLLLLIDVHYNQAIDIAIQVASKTSQQAENYGNQSIKQSCIHLYSVLVDKDITAVFKDAITFATKYVSKQDDDVLSQKAIQLLDKLFTKINVDSEFATDLAVNLFVVRNDELQCKALQLFTDLFEQGKAVQEAIDAATKNKYENQEAAVRLFLLLLNKIKLDSVLATNIAIQAYEFISSDSYLSKISLQAAGIQKKSLENLCNIFSNNDLANRNQRYIDNVKRIVNNAVKSGDSDIQGLGTKLQAVLNSLQNVQ